MKSWAGASFSLQGLTGRSLIRVMVRRRKQSRSLLAPLAGNLIKRLSNADARLRRKVVRWGFWIIGLLFAYSLMSGTYGIPRIIRLELERKALAEDNRHLMIALIDQARVKRLLETDRHYLEYIARTRHRMVYPDETIYYYRNK